MIDVTCLELSLQETSRQTSQCSARMTLFSPTGISIFINKWRSELGDWIYGGGQFSSLVYWWCATIKDIHKEKVRKRLPNRETADRIVNVIWFGIVNYEITFRHIAMVQVIARNQRAVNINNFTIKESIKKSVYQRIDPFITNFILKIFFSGIHLFKSL